MWGGFRTGTSPDYVVSVGVIGDSGFCSGGVGKAVLSPARGLDKTATHIKMGRRPGNVAQWRVLA